MYLSKLKYCDIISSGTKNLKLLITLLLNKNHAGLLINLLDDCHGDIVCNQTFPLFTPSIN